MSMYTARAEDIAPFGAAWCGPQEFVHSQKHLVARYRKPAKSDGQIVEVYCVACPARFYLIRARKGKNSVGRVKPEFALGTGSSMAVLAADMADSISKGMLGMESNLPVLRRAVRDLEKGKHQVPVPS